MKRVGIIQSCYIPWVGYFDFIDSVDLFIVYDDVLFSKGSWRNRNQVKTPSGLKWLTVPVTGSIDMPIDRVMISRQVKPWQDKHRSMLRDCLGPAPFFSDAINLLEECVAAGDTMISQLNVRLIKHVCAYLDITTPIRMSRDFALTGSKTERLIDLLKKVGATVYLSGPSASGYLDEGRFREEGIRLEYKTYDYAPYTQLWGEFIGAVTVLDLIANVGPESRGYLKSRSEDLVVVP